MELHELHVAQLGPGAVGRRHAVAGRHGRIGRLAVDHAGPAAGQDGLLGPDEQSSPGSAGHTRAPTQAPSCVSRSRVKVRSQMVMLGVCASAVDDGPHHLEAGGVAQRVDDAVIAVPALDARLGVELRAVADEVVDLLRRLAHHHLDHGAVAQARPRRSACPRCGPRSDPRASGPRRCLPGRRCCC